MTRILAFESGHWTGVWHMIEPVFRAGDTYTFDPCMSEDEAYRIWVTRATATFVATDDDARMLGTYYIKPNQAGPGAHVCNCGYIVDAGARGMGVASAMCEHSQREAVARGFRAMQYNAVVSANEGAIRLWRRHGFEIVGTLPHAFHHPRDGYVDVFVMYKWLDA